MLGDRIRKLRKQKKLTLEALAGEGLTKGMLSLIENNKAQPSMESLAYIAEGLGVEVTDLLEEVSTLELREVLDKAEKLYNEKKDKVGDKYQQLLTLIEPYVKNPPQGYEGARLLDIYSRSLYEEKIPGWENFVGLAATMYDKMNVTANRAQIAIFRSMVKFIEHDYSKALEMLLSERKEIKANHVYIDPMTQVDLDYSEAILHFAVGDFDAATHVMENALIFSKKHRIFYRANDLYRIGAGQAMMFSDKERREHYLLKLKQYGDFAEDPLSILVHDLLIAMTLIAENKEYENALKILDQYLANPQEEEVVKSLYIMEKGKALYGLGEFAKAIRQFEKVETPTTTHHPFDLSLFYVRYSYTALCYLKLGEMENALQSAKMAVKNFENIPSLPYKEFAIETYNAILAKINPVQS